MKVDMSAKAVTERLKRVSQLRRLCVSLSKAKPVEKEKTPYYQPDYKQPGSK